MNNKFYLIIADDNEHTRKSYLDMFAGKSGHYMLKDWQEVKEFDNADDAYGWLSSSYFPASGRAIVLADACMGPNCDGSNIMYNNKLFGGFVLVDKIYQQAKTIDRNLSDEDKLCNRVKVLLMSFYGDIEGNKSNAESETEKLVREYKNGKHKEIFPYINRKDYFFVNKPIVKAQHLLGINSEDEAVKKWEGDKDVFEATVNAIRNIISKTGSVKSANRAGGTLIIGRSSKIVEINKMINKISNVDVSVLITGESGTGKELIAQTIHSRSNRATKPMITVNCGAIPEGIIESELFGHEKGSFTGASRERKGHFEMADGGTIFLDEIGELPLTAQVKFLRILENSEFLRVGSSTAKKVDVRVIAATNKNLNEEVKAGRFREDLYYRFEVKDIVSPPLRERKDDIPILTSHFLQEFKTKYQKPNIVISVDALEALNRYYFQGNVRELRSIIGYCVLIADGDKLDKTLVEAQFKNDKTVEPVVFNEFVTLKELEKKYIFWVLEKTKNADESANRKKAAEILDIDESNFSKGLKGMLEEWSKEKLK